VLICGFSADLSISDKRPVTLARGAGSCLPGSEQRATARAAPPLREA
jgi:hypothetical protein